MNPALWKLIRLMHRAAFRRLLRGAKTVRGALVLLFLVVMIGVVFLPGMIMTLTLRNQPELTRFHGGVAPYLSIILMVLSLRLVLTNHGASQLIFSPSEVDFLFAGPFHRRDLLLYKLSRTGAGAVLGALFLSMTPIAFFFNGFFSAFVGLALSFIFMHLASLAATLSRLLIAESAHSRARRLALIVATTLAAVALPQAIARTHIFRAAELATSFRTTWPGRVLLAPFEIFSNAMLAERWFPDLVGWGAAAAAIDLALLILVLKLDASYLEWSDEISRAFYERVQRLRKSGGFAFNPARRASRFRIPRLPWLGGAGPVAWRQVVLTIRKSGGLVRMTLAFTVLALIWSWFSAGWTAKNTTPTLVLGLISYATYFICAGFPVAFLGDLDHLDVLKALPIHPLAVATGQFAGCVAVLAPLQVAILAIYGAASGGWVLVAAAMLAPLVDWLLLATNNFLFLILPVRATAGKPADLNAIGHGCLAMLLQLLILSVLMVIPAGLAAGAYLVSGFSMPVLVAAAFVAILAELVPITMLVAWAFDRYDPSTDTPAS